MTRRRSFASSATRTRSGVLLRQQRDGVISGYVLKLLRRSLGLSQETFAERLAVDPNTVQGWETGRRSLTNTSAAKFAEIRRRLLRLGVPASLVTVLDVALDADSVLTTALTGDQQDPDPASHPLATWVTTRVFNELLAWPITGVTPRALQPLADGRQPGPSAAHPTLTLDEQHQLASHLRSVAERSLQDGDALHPSGLLLRRQVYYLLAPCQDGETRTWLTDMQQAEQRRMPRLDGWSPLWVAARSLVVARAVQGDSDPLLGFIQRSIAGDDACEAAGLNYWAYWVGEASGTPSGAQHADEFMAAPNLGNWRGALLLAELAGNLRPGNPYLALCVHAIWALIGRRGWLLADDASLTITLRDKVAALLDHEGLPASTRLELAQVAFAVRAAEPRDRD